VRNYDGREIAAMTQAAEDANENQPSESEEEGQAVGRLFQEHRDRLKLVVRLRMDQRLRGRIDASDVLQEAYVEALERYPDFLQDRPMPFFLWLRFIAVQKLHLFHRRHLGTKARDAGREISLNQPLPQVSSEILAAQLVGKHSTPSQTAMQAEVQTRLQEALESMNPIDREILALRHFEQLTNLETAQVLGLKESTASQRYGRALLRLKDLLLSLPGFSESQP
jgi:RNA polymerase sigma-70 factor (ECF subfamily)